MPSFRQARPLLVAAALMSLLSTAGAQSRDRYREERHRLVDEDIAGEGVRNPRVLQAMRDVPRHVFVPPALRDQAYFDMALAIGNEQTISPPFIVAYMTEALDPQPEDRVLEIGTGSGYQAAVLSSLVKEVYTIEIIGALGRSAERRLSSLGYKNVHVKIGDGYQGWPDHAPFDRIIVTCSPENVPQPLVDQLNEGGRMIIPLGERYQQVFHLLEKQDGKLVETKLLPTLFVPMTGKSEDLRQVKPDPAHPRIMNGGFEEVRDDGLAAGWHYQRRTALLEEKAPEGTHYICFENTDSRRSSHILQGLAVDGNAVGALNVSFMIRVERVRHGTDADEQPQMMIYFFDQRRAMVGHKIIGPWLVESENWQKVSQPVSVPAAAREAVLRVGLNRATGRLCVDNIALTPMRR